MDRDGNHTSEGEGGMSSSRQIRTAVSIPFMLSFGGGEGGWLGHRQNSAARFPFLRDQSAVAFAWGTTSRIVSTHTSSLKYVVLTLADPNFGVHFPENVTN